MTLDSIVEGAFFITTLSVMLLAFLKSVKGSIKRPTQAILELTQEQPFTPRIKDYPEWVIEHNKRLKDKSKYEGWDEE